MFIERCEYSRDLYSQSRQRSNVLFLPDQQFYPGLWCPGKWVCDHWGTQEGGGRRWLKISTQPNESFIIFLKLRSMFLYFNYSNPWFPDFDVFSRQQKDLRLGAQSIHKILFTFKWDPTSPEAPTWQPIETSFWSMLEKLSDSTAACGF